MRKNVICSGLLISSLLFLAASTGCSGTDAAFTGLQVGRNMSHEDTYLRIRLDGEQAEQNTLKKAATGYSNWKIKEQVTTTPKLAFTIKKPEKLGRITMVVVNIYQQFEADYSHQPDFTIVPRNNTEEAQMKPDTDYDLSNPGGTFKILDVRGNEIPKVDMHPGMKYKLLLTIKADKSETAAIEFKTK